MIWFCLFLCFILRASGLIASLYFYLRVKSYLSWHHTNSSNPRRTSHQNRRQLQKADRKPHRLVLPLLLLRGDLVGVTTVVVVSSSRVCLGFSYVAVVGLRLSWFDESVAIVWEWHLWSLTSFSTKFWILILGKKMVLIFGFLRRQRSNGF